GGCARRGLAGTGIAEVHIDVDACLRIDIPELALELCLYFLQLGHTYEGRRQVPHRVRHLSELPPPRGFHDAAEHPPALQRQLTRALRPDEHKADEGNDDEFR